MTYQKTFSHVAYGLIRIILGLFSVLLSYGTLFYITFYISKVSDILYGNHGPGIQLFVILFGLIWLCFGTAFSYWLLKSGYQALQSKRMWVIDINNKTFYHQSPHSSIGVSFSISLKDIKKIVKKGDTAEYCNWFMHCTNGKVINISDNSPFNTKVIVKNLLSENPAIEYYEE